MTPVPLTVLIPLTALGAASFAALVWGSVGLVLVVFGYVAVAYARELLGGEVDDAPLDS